MFQRHHVISQGIEVLANKLKSKSDSPCDFDVIVIGSGYGGAVAAARLSAKFGSKLAVFERGQEYPLGKFPSAMADLPNQIRGTSPATKKSFGNPSALFDVRLSNDVNVLVGNGLGGGSLINAGVMAMPDESIFELQEDVFPIDQKPIQKRRVWPQEISLTAGTAEGKTLAAAYNEALRAIEPETVPTERVSSDSQVNSIKVDTRTMPQKALAMSRLAHGAGLADEFSYPEIAVTFQARTNIHGVVQNACIQCGDCFSGCNYGAKNTLDRTYLASAFKNNAQIYVGVSVLRVEPDLSPTGQGGWLLHIVATNPALRHALGGEMVIKARYVVLAAGALGSTEILKRSSYKDSTTGEKRMVAPSSTLGSRFSGNGDVIAVGADHKVPVNAVVNPAVAARYRRIGPTITGMIDLRRHGPWQKVGDGPVIQELNSPGILQWVFSELVGNGTFLQRFSQGDKSTYSSTPHFEPLSIDPSKMGSHQVYAMFGLDQSQGKVGTFNYGKSDSFAEGSAYVDWATVRKPPVVNLFSENHALLRKLIQDSGIGDGLLANPMWEPFSPLMASMLFGAKRGPLISVHPLGGCPMASDAAYGVVNHYGQVFSGESGTQVHESLVVLDGAIIPTSLGINPGLTISALAERSVQHLVGAWTVTDSPASAPQQALLLQVPPASGDLINSSAVQPAGIVLSERMLGSINLPNSFTQSLKNYWTSMQPIRGGQAKLSMELSIGPILNVYEFTNDPQHTLQIQHARLHYFAPSSEVNNEATEPGLIPVRGSVKFARRVSSEPWQRRLRAINAMLMNGYLYSQLKELLFSKRFSGYEARFKEVADLAWRLISVIGEIREYHYEMIVTRNFYVHPDGRPCKDNDAEQAPEKTLENSRVLLFAKGDRLIGKKAFFFGFKANPWVQFTTLELFLQRVGSESRLHIGALRSDLSYFANFNSFLIKVFQQGDVTTSFAHVGSLLLFFGRAIASAHLLTFKTQRYVERALKEFSPKASRPGEVEGARRNNLHTLKGDLRHVRLTHYWADKKPSDQSDEAQAAHQKSVLFIHGFGASSNTFTESSRNKKSAVSHMIASGLDVWLVDLRTSNASRLRRRFFSFDEIGDTDIVQAVDYIQDWKRQHKTSLNVEEQKIAVVAHCIGVAMLSNALLNGRLKQRIARLVLTQVGFVVELTAYNHARNALLAGIRQFVGNAYFDTRVWPKEARNALGTKGATPALSEPAASPPLDWLLSSFVYRSNEWLTLSSWWRQPSWLAQYNRMSALYAPLMTLNNMHRATLERLHLLIAGVNIKGYSQTLFYSLVRRLTNRHGEVLLSVDAIAKNVDFPLLFLSGSDNRVFHPSGAARSAQLVANAWAQAGINDARKVYSLEIEGYGHQDLWLGKNAYADVLPEISSFLTNTHGLLPTQPSIKPEARRIRTAYASVIGPTLGWLRRTDDGWTIRVQFAFDRIAKTPESILCLFDLVNANVSAATGLTSAGSERSVFYELGHKVFNKTAVHIHKPMPPETLLDIQALSEKHPSNIIYIDLPLAQSLYPAADTSDSASLGMQVYLVSVHADEPIDSTSHQIHLPEGYFTRVMSMMAGETAAVTGSDADSIWDDFSRRLDPDVNGLSRNQTNAETAAMGFPALDRLQQFAAIFLSHQSLLAADSAVPVQPLSRIDFAITSCHSPHFLFDRELAGASYRRIAARLDTLAKVDLANGANATPAMKVPSFLIAMGDQVYMDAAVTQIGTPIGVSNFEKPYTEWLGNPSVRSVVSRIPLYPMLDDHEYKNGYVPAAATDPKSPEDCCYEQVYQVYQRKLAPQGPNLQPWYTLNQGGYPFFILDTRHQRQARNLYNLPTATIIGAEQMTALKEWLLANRSATTPIFLVSPSVVFPMHSRLRKEYGGDALYAFSEDGWDAYPQSFEDLLTFIANEQLQNIVILSGDYHMSFASVLEVTAPHQAPVCVLSIVSSGSYLPYRAAIETQRDIAFNVESTELPSGVRYRYRTFEQTITSANSIAVITAQCVPSDVNSLHEGASVFATFDTSEGPLLFARDLSLPFDGVDVSRPLSSGYLLARSAV
jgi:cholesterol oxidase